MGVTVHKDKQGPVWPLGQIAVATPGTQVSIMSLVDPSSVNAPETATPGTVGSDEYTCRAYAIIFMPFKAGSGTILAANTSNKLVYVVRKPTAGNGGTADTGVVVIALRPGDPPFVLTGAALNRNMFNLYEFFIDADSAGDGMQVTALIG
jgi:hypothetical protein